jgi:hypothetical protein
MAQLLRQAIDSGAPPSMARLPMTPEDVAASYDAIEAGEYEDDGARDTLDDGAQDTEDEDGTDYEIEEEALECDTAAQGG